jgi:hypothetical protein
MKRTEKVLLALCGAVLDFAWLYAWAAFSVISLEGNGFPFVNAAVIFAAAALLTRIHTARGLRVIVVVLLQGTGLAAAVLATLYVISGTTQPFLHGQWFTEFFAASHSAVEWLRLGITLFWSIVFWVSGAFFALRPRTHRRICSRFDLGLAAFFALVLLKLALAAKGDIFTGDTMTGPLAFVFFFFGLMAIGMTRTGAAVSPGPVRGRRRLGVVLGFILAVFVSAAGLVLFFQQPLARAAGTGYELLKGGAASAGGVFLWLMRLLYSPNQGKMRQPPSGSGTSIPDHVLSSGGSPWLEVVGRIMTWLFGTVLGVMILIGMVAASIYLVRWLFSRTRGKESGRRSESLPGITRRAWSLVTLLAGRVRRLIRGRKTAADFYDALTGWSRRSGIRQSRTETPSEFSSRLSGMFPALTKEIGSIVEAFNREFYGEIALTGREMTVLRTNRRRLASPSLWPARLRTLAGRQITPRC